MVSDIRNPFFADVARGAEDAACRAGCDLVLCNSDLDAEKQMRYVRSLVEKRVDGILMNSVASLSRPQQAELSGLGVPVVLLNRPADLQTFSTVCADNLQGGRLAATYLLGLGHRALAHLTGPRRHGNLTERARGFLKAAPAATVLYGDHTLEGGYHLASRLLAQQPLATAVFAANDAMAFGVIRAARERGLKVPDDLSVVGFDNVEMATIMEPALTTIHQPKYEMGEAAVEILLKMATRASGAAPEHRLLGVELIARHSCREWRSR